MLLFIRSTIGQGKIFCRPTATYSIVGVRDITLDISDISVGTTFNLYYVHI